MKYHFQYLIYVFRHKWFVFIACMKLKVPLHLAIIHDWTKFTPSEWSPYVQKFFWPEEKKQDEIRKLLGDSAGIAELIPYGLLVEDRFTMAVNHHYHFNKHHWEYWVVHKPNEKSWGLPMPEKYIREMIADWVGAGMAITKNPDPSEWYKKNKEKIILRNETREKVEKIIDELKYELPKL